MMNKFRWNYYVFLIVCYLTLPVRKIIQIITYPFSFAFLSMYLSDFDFGVHLLFPNNFARQWVVSQSKTEVGSDITGWDLFYIPKNTGLVNGANNYFGMRPSLKGKYQSGSVDNGNGKFATYWSVYQSIFDYYSKLRDEDRKAHGTQKYFEFLFWGAGLPQQSDFDASNAENSVSNNYMAQCLATFALEGYFTSAESAIYASNMATNYMDFKPRNTAYYFNLVCCIVVYSWLAVYCSNRAYRSRFKSQAKKVFAKLKFWKK